jgi:hypothetical protein
VIADQVVWAVCGRQWAVVNIAQSSKQNVVIDVILLVGVEDIWLFLQSGSASTSLLIARMWPSL